MIDKRKVWRDLRSGIWPIRLRLRALQGQNISEHCKVNYDLHIQHCIDPKPYFATRRQDQMNNRGSVIMKACMKM
jgi:hypothetical protein